DRAIGLNEKISRMRIGMEEPVLANHFEDNPGCVISEPAAIRALFVEGLQIVDLYATYSLQGEHARGCGFPKHTRNMNMWVGSEVNGKPLGVVGLANVIELPAQRLRKLFHQTTQIIMICKTPMPARGSGELVEDLEILIHLFNHSGPPNFDNDLGAVAKSRRMRLPDGGCSQRDGINARKDMFKRLA